MKLIYLSSVFASIFAFNQLDAQVLINEVQHANLNTLMDEDGQFKDWFELYNSGSEPIDLQGYGISDRLDNPMKWVFPSWTISPSEHLLIWASGKNRGNGGAYHSIVQASESWSYLIPQTEPTEDWRTLEYNDENWNTGEGGFGYGDGDDGTDLGGGIQSVFMRKSFSLPEVIGVSEVLLHMDFDDAFVAYLNGIEIARFGIGTPGIYPAFNEASAVDHEALGYQGQPIDLFMIDQITWSNALNVGENVLAIQVHNTSANSSDLTANAWLTFGFISNTALFPPAPEWMQLGNTDFLHTNFALTSGETLALFNPDGNLLNQISIPLTAADHSYRRESDGFPFWCFSNEPTPGISNNGAACATSYEPIPNFSITSGIYVSSQSIELSTLSPSAEIRFTLDGSIPNESSELYTEPLQIDVTVTVSARCFSTAALLPSRVEKNTYLIDESGLDIPVICISTNPENLWDENIGIYVLGPPDYDGYPYFGSNIWEDWERESYIEYFSASGEVQFEGSIGLKIHGGWSRGLPQKSFRVIARDDYGMESMDYPLIADKPYLNSFKSFNLRNGGNEYYGTRYHDALMQRAMKPTHADYMAYTPVVAFLNGEYWGMYELRENLNEDFCEANHGVPAEDCTVISSNYLGWNVINGSDEPFYEMYDFVMASDPQSDNFYFDVSQYIDFENYMDYIIAETYYGNGDWNNGWNNTKFWLDERPGGKWRFMLMDLDFGTYDNPCSNYLNAAANGGTSTGQIFGHIISNPQFRREFVTRYLDLINQVFTVEKITAIRDEMRSESEAVMPRHCERWGSDFFWWYNGYDDRINWHISRRECMISVLQDHFGMYNPIEVTLDVQPAGAGRIHISTVEPSEGEYPWTGTYFNGLPIKITAIANPGFEFSHWSPNTIFPVEVGLDQFVLNLEQNESFIAHFTGEDAENAIEVSEFMYNSGTLENAGDWIELHNKLDIPLDVSSMILQDKFHYNSFPIPPGTIIPPDGYRVIAQHPELFAAQHPEVNDVIGPLGFGLSNEGDLIRLFKFNSENLISFEYSETMPWFEDTDGTGRSVEFLSENEDQNNPSNWFPGCIGGSPEIEYDPNCGLVSVDENAQTDWRIYPNPATSFVRIDFPNAEGDTQLILTDVAGKTIDQHAMLGRNFVQMDISGLPRGMYFIRVSGSTNHPVQKLVIR